MNKNHNLVVLLIAIFMGMTTTLFAQDEPIKKKQGVNIIITQSPKIIVTVQSIQHNTCNEESKGAIDISAEGGYPPYKYYWNHGDTAQDVASLKAGKYRVAVYDNFSCSDTVEVVINQPPVLKAKIVSIKDILCYGYNQGEIDIEVEGGAKPYRYSWNNGAVSQDIKGVNSGRYSVLITDGNNCQEIITADIAEKPLIIRTVDDVENILCFGDETGKINISVDGGVAPYRYFWSNGDSTEDLSNLKAGTYEVTVQDALGCTEVSTAKVLQPGQLDLNFDNVRNIQCFGDNGGAVNIGVVGGVEPFTYKWSGGQTTQDIAGVYSGNYSVTVTDANGCSNKLETTITQPPKLDVTLVSSRNVSFNGGSDGAVDIEAAGGVPPFKYKWNNGATSQDISKLKIGNYSARVSDATGCSAVINVTINQPSLLMVRIDKAVDIDCNGNSNGEIAITVNGGVKPYKYLWSSGAVEEDLTGLKSGKYTITITDANGFKQSVDTLLKQPNAFIAKLNTVTNINCNGVSEGAVDIEVNGGVEPYKYHWSNGMVTQDIIDVLAGDYTVKIIDANRCEQQLEATITQPEKMITEIGNVVNVACNGRNTGSIDISVVGGVLPYKYVWNNGLRTQDLKSTAAGDYSVTVTDARGCEQILNAKISEPVKLLVQEDRIKNIDCFGSNTGEVALIVSGGITPYKYTWNNGDSVKNISNLRAGKYSVTISDANGCSVSYSKTLTQPSRLQASLAGVVNNLCFGENKGEVNINVAGGITPYSYRWNSGGTSQDIINLKSGQYKVEVRDANRCLDSLSATIIENPLLETTVEVKNISCNGESSGAINLSVKGGVAPYTYKWSNGAVTQDVSRLKTGQYSVVVTDSKGCFKQIDAHVIEPSRFVAILQSEQHIKCYGDNTGNINVKVNGGSAPYTYKWSNGATTEDLKDILAGSYSLVVSDNNGCSETIRTVITQPTRVVFNIKSVTNLTCNKDNSGAIDISITGGLGPYNYKWSNGTTTQDLVGVAAGKYSVTISEANGCSKTLEATITEPPLLSLKIDNVTHILCNGNTNGAIAITAAGGVPPYKYSWSHGSVRSDVIGLGSGKYSITVTDAKGCTKIMASEVREPAPFVASLASVKNILCNGENTGEIKLSVRGGARPYKFVWSSGDTTQNLSGKRAGSYSVSITDKNGCKQPVAARITQPSKLVTSMVSSSNVSCYGTSTGSINITVVGGATPYTYNWSNGSKLQDQTDIPSGTYSVGISDANGCKDSTIVVTITQPEKLVAKLDSVTHITTYGLSTGAVNVSVQGGTTPYTYSWSNGALTRNIRAVPAGNYSVRVIDGRGCEVIVKTLVKQPPSLDVKVVSIKDIICSRNSSGAITVSVTGGVKPYTYAWNSGDSTQNISNISAGDYSLTVSDANGHRKVVNAKVSEPTSINVTVDHITHILCQGDESGEVIVSVTGGVSPYKYSWNNGTLTKDLTKVKAGNYSLKVTDKNGCLDSIQVTVSQPELLLAKIVSTKNIICNGDNMGEVQIEVSGGSTPYSYSWSNGARTRDISEVVAGKYNVKITDANGCFRELSTIISEPPKLIATLSEVKDNLCNGDNGGEIKLSVNGGVGKYTYIWSHGDSTRNATGLIAGEYAVIVRDSLGCEQKLSASITEPTKLTAAVDNITNVKCSGEINGGVEVNVEGGSAPYTYTWSNESSSQNLTNIVAGDYVLKVKDAKGCEFSVNAQVTEPPLLALKLDAVQDNPCAFETKGLIDITVSGGVTPYVYTWSNGAKTEDLVNIISNTYSVQVKDANGCLNNLTATVKEPDLLTVAVDSITSLKCNGDQNGFVSLKVLGGAEPYSYLWNTGATTASLRDVAANEYQARVSDKNGCIANITTVIEQPTALIKTIDAITDIRCYGDSTGAIHVTALEGSAPYQFEWNNGKKTADISGLKAGNYKLKITEANGCTSNLEATIEQPSRFASKLESVKDVRCFGDETGAVDISVSGGVEPYAFAWSNGSTSEDIKNVIADNYSVLITDANGCLNTINTKIKQPEELALKIDSVRNVKCCGDNSGAIYVSIFGGVKPYDYLWSNGAKTQDIENLILGNYTLNVTDSYGCIITSLDDEQLNLYEQIVTIGKFTTRDILFDVSRATIKPESFRTINKIATLMKEHPDLTFRIDGHTDSDGGAAFNQKLSEDRAISIKRALIKFGIGETRLYVKGWGEVQPIATNLTRAGKKKNRRVEFISLTGTLTGTMVENTTPEQ